MACCSSVQWNSSISETVRNRTHVHIHFLLTMTDTVTSRNIDLSYSFPWTTTHTHRAVVRVLVEASTVLSIFTAFLSSWRQIPGFRLELGDDRFSRHLFAIIKFQAIQISSELSWCSMCRSQSCYSSVGVATGCGLDNRGVGVRVPVGKRFLSSPVVQTCSGAHSLLSNGYRG
jgi:hypothetical protein